MPGIVLGSRDTESNKGFLNTFQKANACHNIFIIVHNQQQLMANEYFIFTYLRKVQLKKKENIRTTYE